MITEKYTREAGLGCTWTIIRPQTIWGPWSLRYRDVMFRVMRKGLYFHPSKNNVYRAYGYVKNVVWQIQQILEAPKEKVHQQVFYVGDKPINLLDWVQCISHELTGKSARIIPTPFVRGLALTGDVLKKLNISFPITSTRFNSMTQDYLTPVDKTYKTLGQPLYNMKEGAKEIVEWYYKESESAVYPASRKLKAKLINNDLVTT
jgi:nucleoside-diphosphate-sugar epimerase